MTKHKCLVVHRSASSLGFFISVRIAWGVERILNGPDGEWWQTDLKEHEHKNGKSMSVIHIFSCKNEVLPVPQWQWSDVDIKAGSEAIIMKTYW